MSACQHVSMSASAAPWGEHPPIEPTFVKNGCLCSLHHVAPPIGDVGDIFGGQAHVMLAVFQEAVLCSAAGVRPIVVQKHPVDKFGWGDVASQVNVYQPIYEVLVPRVPQVTAFEMHIGTSTLNGVVSTN